MNKISNTELEFRIVVETEVSGKKWYYVQKRWLWFFWKYITEVRDMSMCRYAVRFNTLQESELAIQKMVDSYRASQERKIIRRQYKLRKVDLLKTTEAYEQSK